MGHFAYLAYLVIALAGITAIAFRRGILDHRLVRAVLVTVAVFFLFDTIGVARGWFYTAPSLNVWILPGGVSIEEVIDLVFLTVLSIELSFGIRRRRHE
jgi:hypothetical protein